MATLQERLVALAGAIRDKLNAMTPRLLPAGGGPGQVLARTGSADYAVGWASPGFDISIPCADKPAAGEVLLDLFVVRPFTLPLDLAGSGGQATDTATATATCTITKNGTPVATVTYEAGAIAPTLAAAQAIAFAVDDRMRFIAPAPQDVTLANFTTTLAVQR